MSRGAALPVVLFALAMVSALSVGGLFVAQRQAVSAQTSQRGSGIETVAESILVTAVANWDSAARSSQPIGTTWSLGTSITPFLRASGWITRSSALDYWIVAEASETSKPLLRRRLGVGIRCENGRPRLASPRAWLDLP
jgi:hypothetical protein